MSVIKRAIKTCLRRNAKVGNGEFLDGRIDVKARSTHYAHDHVVFALVKSGAKRVHILVGPIRLHLQAENILKS